MTDRARPGLAALYDIRPGNGTGQFLQPARGGHVETDCLDLSHRNSVLSGSSLRRLMDIHWPISAMQPSECNAVSN